MIGYLSGAVRHCGSESLILSAGGVGYEVHCTPRTLTSVGDEIELWIYTQVREDALQLFGFLTLQEKELFLSLIKVNGIGPKSALQILAASTVQQIVDLINHGDAKGLSQLPKVGKKTAEQIVLTLKGKLVSAESHTATVPTHRQEVISALVHLGFRLVDVEKALEKMGSPKDVESGVREGLSMLTGGGL